MRFGGIAKGHPNQKDIDKCLKFYNKIKNNRFSYIFCFLTTIFLFSIFVLSVGPIGSDNCPY